MTPPANHRILIKLGVFSTKEAVEAGISRPTISRIAASGEIIKLAHGFYMHPNATLELKEIDFILAYKKFGRCSYIGGLSSLFRHGLIDEVPDRVWVVVPSTVRSTDSFYRCIRSIQTSKAGIEKHKNFQIAGVHRSVIDGLRFSAKIGRKIAIVAARKALRSGASSEKNLYEIAKKTDCVKTLEKFWEAITSD